VWYIDLLVEDRDAAVAVHNTGFMLAKDILGRRVRFRQGKRTKEAIASLSGIFKA